MWGISYKDRFVSGLFITYIIIIENFSLGVQPLWLKDGRRIITTLLHVTDCHVVRVTTRSDICF